MKKTTKKVTFLLICLALVMSFLPQLTTFASAATVIDSGKCGDNLTWTLDTDGTLTISGTGAMDSWYYGGGPEPEYFSPPWYLSLNQIKKVIISESVSSIGEAAFCDCTNLTEVILPDSLTTIWDYAFSNCSSLKNITIHSSIRSIGSSVFYGCNNLFDIYFDGTKNQWDAIFYNSDSLPKNATVHFLKGIATGKCGDNVNYTLDTDYKLTISGTGDMYASWNELDYVVDRNIIKSVVIEDGVTSISSDAFRNCENLTSVTIGNDVTTIGCMAFSDCKSLTNITIPMGVTTISSDAFMSCTSLTSMSIPSTVKSIGSDAFTNCGSFKEVYFYGTSYEWEELKSNIEMNNDLLLKATVYIMVEVNEDVIAYAKDAKNEVGTIKDGSSEVSTLIDEINAQIDTVVKDSSLTVDEAKAQIEKLKKEAKMRCGVLNLRFQISSGTTSGSTKSDMRFISTVDNLKNYKETGFYITINGIKKRIATKNVYSSLVGKNGEAITNYTPSDIFSESKYFSTYTIRNIPNSSFDAPITVQAFVVLRDGTEILGVEKTRKVSNFIISYN